MYKHMYKDDVTHYVFGSMRHMDAFSFQSRNIGPTVEANLLMTIAINNSRYAKVHNIMSSTIARYRDMRGMNVAEGSINKAHNPMATNNNRIASDSERPLHKPLCLQERKRKPRCRRRNRPQGTHSDDGSTTNENGENVRRL
uniref:Uncharacterized protein n=1 Tax=Glossina austeni TaxID=7395 RepID=A0A1A9V7L2_GLOAU